MKEMSGRGNMEQFYLKLLELRVDEYEPNQGAMAAVTSANDCVIRACSKLLEKDWDTVFKELSEIAYDKKLLLNHRFVVCKYLEQFGYKSFRYGGNCSNRITVGEYMQKNKRGKHLVATSGHIAAFIDGTIYDIKSKCEKNDQFLTSELEMVFAIKTTDV